MTQNTTANGKRRANAAVYFHDDGFDPTKKELNGRRVAGASFLRGYVQHCGSDTLAGAIDGTKQAAAFKQFLAGAGFTGQVKTRPVSRAGIAGDAEAVQMPGPNLAEQAWRRLHLGGRGYSICGVTHTTATARVMQGMFDMRAAPVQEWDGVIMTSKAVKASMTTLLDEADEYLKERFFVPAAPPRFQTPVIPLGIHCDDFAHDPAARASWRKRLNIPEREIVVMTMSRLNAFAKFDPLPMFAALEIAAARAVKRVHFLAVGPYSDNPSSRVFAKGAKRLAPSVSYHHIDGTKEPMAAGLWSAADIFALPVDNIQETFGLAPVEAMAAGLPVVVSDWDGFRDTVTPETGFRIPTMGPADGALRAEALRHFTKSDSYVQYISQAAFQTAIDVPKMAAAFAALIDDRPKRMAMGQAGVARARAVYDWSVVIPQYQEFWGELSAIRRATQGEGYIAKPGRIPMAMDPAELFSSYPTGQFDFTNRAFSALTEIPAETAVEDMVKLREIPALKRSSAGVADYVGVLAAIQKTGRAGYAQLQSTDAARSVAVLDRCLIWLLKFNLIGLETD